MSPATIVAGTGYPSLEEIRANPIPKDRRKEASRELALDISSSCVGWALGSDRKPLRWGKFVFKTTAEVGEKLVSFEEFLRVLIETYKPDRLLIEKPPARRGKTTERHFELVGIARKVWAELTGKEILPAWMISPTTIKRAMGVPSGRDHKENKAIMVKKINSLFGLNLRVKKNSDSRVLNDDDIADAIAVLETYYRKKDRSR